MTERIELAGWVIEPVTNWKATWCATKADDTDVTAHIEDGCLVVLDGTQYYAGASYRVPLEVVDKLRELARDSTCWCDGSFVCPRCRAGEEASGTAVPKGAPCGGRPHEHGLPAPSQVRLESDRSDLKGDVTYGCQYAARQFCKEGE